MQPPNKIPGPTAHQAHGTPLGYEIESINSTPLMMEAHQTLGMAIPIARCREIQVEIENRDNKIRLDCVSGFVNELPHHPKIRLSI